MYEEEEVRRIFGDEALKYLKNKHRGGTSGGKGTRYENFFAVYQLAYRAQAVIEGEKTIAISSQILAFVDDLIIDCSENPLQHYQLKDSATLTWGTGLRSIADDFKKQHDLNQATSRTSRLYLIVSDPVLRTNLASSIPERLRDYSQVDHFPAATNLMEVIQQDPSFCAAIEYLSAFENPDPDKIECVATVLLGAWVSSNKTKASVLEILKKAQDSTPSFIRSFDKDLKLDPEVEKILGSVKNFTYNLTKGFLHWQFQDGLDEGTLPYSIETDRFKRFQDLLKKHCPTNFEELERFLI